MQVDLRNEANLAFDIDEYRIDKATQSQEALYSLMILLCWLWDVEQYPLFLPSLLTYAVQYLALRTSFEPNTDSHFSLHYYSYHWHASTRKARYHSLIIKVSM